MTVLKPDFELGNLMIVNPDTGGVLVRTVPLSLRKLRRKVSGAEYLETMQDMAAEWSEHLQIRAVVVQMDS